MGGPMGAEQRQEPEEAGRLVRSPLPAAAAETPDAPLPHAHTCRRRLRRRGRGHLQVAHARHRPGRRRAQRLSARRLPQGVALCPVESAAQAPRVVPRVAPPASTALHTRRIDTAILDYLIICHPNARLAHHSSAKHCTTHASTGAGCQRRAVPCREPCSPFVLRALSWRSRRRPGPPRGAEPRPRPPRAHPRWLQGQGVVCKDGQPGR